MPIRRGDAVHWIEAAGLPPDNDPARLRPAGYRARVDSNQPSALTAAPSTNRGT